MVAYCPECGGEITADDQFCQHCGTDLTEGPTSGASTGDQDEWGQHAKDVGERETVGGYDQGRTGADDQRGESADTGWDTGGQQADGRYGIPRKDAMETIQLSAGWLFSITTFLGVLVVVEFVNSLSVFIPALAILLIPIGFVLRPLLAGVGALYADHLVRLDGGQDPVLQFGDAFDQALSKVVTLIAIQILYLIAVIIGLILLIIPGIYIGARLSLAIPACVLDDQGVTESLSTSWDVADGNVLKLVAIFFILLIPAFAIGLIPEPGINVIASPVFAIINGIVYLAVGRIYLENVTGSDAAH